MCGINRTGLGMSITKNIVAMTADSFEEDRRKVLECGMNGHIVKPIYMTLIADILDKVFEEAK